MSEKANNDEEREVEYSTVHVRGGVEFGKIPATLYSTVQYSEMHQTRM